MFCRRFQVLFVTALLLVWIGSPMFLTGQSSLSGVVVDSDGNPMADTNIYLVDSRFGMFDNKPVDSKPATGAKTNANGEFSLPLESKHRVVGIIYKPGYGISLTNFYPPGHVLQRLNPGSQFERQRGEDQVGQACRAHAG